MEFATTSTPPTPVTASAPGMARRSPGPGRVASALLAGLLLGLAGPAMAQLDTTTRDRLQQEIAEQEARLTQRRAEIGAIETELGDTRARLDAQIVERDRISAELVAVRDELALIRADIGRRELALQDTQAQIAVRNADLDQMRIRIQSLLLDLYRQRSNRFARALANADSYHHLRVQNRFLALLAQQDVAIVNDLKALLADLADLQATLSQQITELQARETERDQTQAKLEATRSELQALINELDASREGQLAQQRALLAAESELEGLVSALAGDLEAAIANLTTQELENRAAAEEFLNNTPPAPVGTVAIGTACADAPQVALPAPLLSSGFIFPVDGARISSPFGRNNNSFLGLRANQPSAAVRSIEEGQISFARFLNANDGYLVVILHGDGLATSYMNLREPLVGEGDRVVQGQLIGCLGGGALNPEDLLKLYVSITTEGRTVQIDPVVALGLQP